MQQFHILMFQLNLEKIIYTLQFCLKFTQICFNVLHHDVILLFLTWLCFYMIVVFLFYVSLIWVERNKTSNYHVHMSGNNKNVIFTVISHWRCERSRWHWKGHIQFHFVCRNWKYIYSFCRPGHQCGSERCRFSYRRSNYKSILWPTLIAN